MMESYRDQVRGIDGEEEGRDEVVALISLILIP